VLALFRADYPATLRKIASAIAAGDAERLRLNAHALKGALATVGSPAGRDAAFELEQMGRSGDLTRAGDAAATLRGVIASLERELVAAKLVSRRLHDKNSRRRR
jgi:HPt (histidine-containing phosphotransfer) domain-containing protein